MYVDHQFNTETHNVIYSMYCAYVHLKCSYMTNTVPGDCCMGFKGDLKWEAVPEVGNLTEVQGQILYCPHLCTYGVVELGIKFDRSIILTIMACKYIITHISVVIHTYVATFIVNATCQSCKILKLLYHLTSSYILFVFFSSVIKYLNSYM